MSKPDIHILVKTPYFPFRITPHFLYQSTLTHCMQKYLNWDTFSWVVTLLTFSTTVKSYCVCIHSIIFKITDQVPVKVCFYSVKSDKPYQPVAHWDTSRQGYCKLLYFCSWREILPSVIWVIDNLRSNCANFKLKKLNKLWNTLSNQLPNYVTTKILNYKLTKFTKTAKLHEFATFLQCQSAEKRNIVMWFACMWICDICVPYFI